MRSVDTAAAADVAPLVDPDRLRAYVDREARHWGGRVRQRREDLGFSLAQCAGLAGSTPQTLHKIESGEITPRDHLRIALAFALSTEVDRLFPYPTRAVMSRELDMAVAS
jgi:DNA-binding XRE family transcriptional regulator